MKKRFGKGKEEKNSRSRKENVEKEKRGGIHLLYMAKEKEEMIYCVGRCF